MSGAISELNTKRKPKAKRELVVFDPANHVRKDWDDRQIEAELERRARGYGGILRQYLCSAAAVISRQRLRITELERDRDSLLDEVDDVREAVAELAEDI